MAKVLESKNVKKLTFVFDPTNANQPPLMDAVTPIFASHGIQVADRVSVDQKQPQFTSTMNQIASSKVDAVYLLTSGASPIMLRELADAQYTGVKVVFTAPESVVSPAGAAADGVLQSVYFTPLKPANDQGKAFIDGWAAAHGGANASSYNAEGYDSIMFVVEAIKRAGSTDRVAIAKAAADVAAAGMTGVQGTYTFDTPDFHDRRAVLGGVVVVYGNDGKQASVVG
jgi:branched-chain amino acid transport system substrate-binding protein